MIFVAGLLITLSLPQLSIYAKNVSELPLVKVVEVETTTTAMPVIYKVAIEEEIQEEVFVYNEKIPMPREHQEYLFNKCKEWELDYSKTLAIISLESNFNSNLISQSTPH